MPWIQAICAATDGPDKPAMTAGERSALAVNVLIIHVISEMCVRPRDKPGHDGWTTFATALICLAIAEMCVRPSGQAGP